jgi:hypothetical protein
MKIDIGEAVYSRLEILKSLLGIRSAAHEDAFGRHQSAEVVDGAGEASAPSNVKKFQTIKLLTIGVLRAIEAREAVLADLLSVVEGLGKRLAGQEGDDDEVLDMVLVRHLERGADVLEAISLWRGELGEEGSRQPFVWMGVSYVDKMVSDASKILRTGVLQSCGYAILQPGLLMCGKTRASSSAGGDLSSGPRAVFAVRPEGTEAEAAVQVCVEISTAGAIRILKLSQTVLEVQEVCMPNGGATLLEAPPPLRRHVDRPSAETAAAAGDDGDFDDNNNVGGHGDGARADVEDSGRSRVLGFAGAEMKQVAQGRDQLLPARVRIDVQADVGDSNSCTSGHSRVLRMELPAPRRHWGGVPLWPRFEPEAAPRAIKSWEQYASGNLHRSKQRSNQVLIRQLYAAHSRGDQGMDVHGWLDAMHLLCVCPNRLVPMEAKTVFHHAPREYDKDAAVRLGLPHLDAPPLFFGDFLLCLELVAAKVRMGLNTLLERWKWSSSSLSGSTIAVHSRMSVPSSGPRTRPLSALTASSPSPSSSSSSNANVSRYWSAGSALSGGGGKGPKSRIDAGRERPRSAMGAISGSVGTAERNSLGQADAGDAGEACEALCVESGKQDSSKVDPSMPRASEEVEEESIIDDDFDEDEGEDEGEGATGDGHGRRGGGGDGDGDGDVRKPGWVDGSYKLSEALSKKMKSDFESAE